MIRHIISQGYSQTLELEADREAIRLTAVAGFDVRASVDALNNLLPFLQPVTRSF